MGTAVVPLGCYNKVPWTGWLVNTRVFLTLLEAGSLRSGCRRGEVLASALLWLADA